MSASQRGIIYVVTGRRHADEACRSATMAKRCLPDLPISIFTDQPIDAPVFEQVLPIPQASGFLSKVIHIPTRGHPLFADAQKLLLCPFLGAV
jgi:hypothetical protein